MLRLLEGGVYKRAACEKGNTLSPKTVGQQDKVLTREGNVLHKSALFLRKLIA